MASFAGYAMPIQYEGIIAEHLWTRENAGLFDVSHMGQLYFAGEGVDEALEALTPADVQGLRLGRQRYSLLLTDDGGIIDDLMLARWGQGIYVVVNAATKGADIAHIEPHLPEGVTMEVLTDRALIALQGPKAADALARHVSGQYGLDDLVFMAGGQFTLAGEDVWISRSGYTGEDGFEISLPAAIVEAVATALCEEPEVKPIGLGARDSLRLEAGLPLYGHDIDETTTPIEADLGFALSKRRREAANFPGAAKILLQREQGAARKRVGLVIEGRQPVREGASVVDAEGEEIGTVTSGGFSPSLERPIAMAYVPADCAESGTEIALRQRGKPFSGTVTAMPFVPHRYHRQPKP
jgi:aminomethyltransferase